MHPPHSLSAKSEHPLDQVVSARSLPFKEGGKLPPEVITALPGCTTRSDIELTRSELAYLFGVCKRTVSRWQERFYLPYSTKNARVIRYTVETVVTLVASGAIINRGESERLGLKCDEILALASTIGAKAEGQGVQLPQSVTYIATTEADQRVIELLRDPTRGDYLRAVAAAILGVKK